MWWWLLQLLRLFLPPLRQASSRGSLGCGGGGGGTLPVAGGVGGWVQGADRVGVMALPQDGLPQLCCGVCQTPFEGRPPMEEGLVIPPGGPLRTEADSLHQGAHFLLILEGSKSDSRGAPTHLRWVGGSRHEVEGKGAVVREAWRLLCHTAAEEIGVEAAMDVKAVNARGLLPPVEGVTPLVGMQFAEGIHQPILGAGPLEHAGCVSLCAAAWVYGGRVIATREEGVEKGSRCSAISCRVGGRGCRGGEAAWECGTWLGLLLSLVESNTKLKSPPMRWRAEPCCSSNGASASSVKARWARHRLVPEGQYTVASAREWPPHLQQAPRSLPSASLLKVVLASARWPSTNKRWLIRMPTPD